jgi:DNA invertase Pin-like site-specific DNA recombinase
MSIRDAVRAVIRCVIYTRISLDKLGDAHGVANQLADLERRAAARGWTVVFRLSDNDIGVTRKDPTTPAEYRPGWEEVLRLVDARAVDVVLVWKWDRALREPLDLEFLIPRFDKAGVRFAEAEGSIDLGTDSGRLHARIMIAVAKAEQDRKAERQKLASERAAVEGKRRLGTPLPGRSRHPPPGRRTRRRVGVRAAAGRGQHQRGPAGWTAAGLAPPQPARAPRRSRNPDGSLPPRTRPPQAGQPAERAPRGWTRSSIRTILLNPAIAGLSVYKGEIVGQGQWEPLVPEQTWRAVTAILTDPGRTPPRGVRTLLGGIARCPCGNIVTGMPSHTGHRIYRCAPATRNRGYDGGHVARQPSRSMTSSPGLVIARISRDDAAGLVVMPGSEAGVAGLREEAAAIRANLEEMGADRALGLITRAQLLAATGRGSARLAEIADLLADAARENVLAGLAAADDVAAAWQAMDSSRQRAVITTLMDITLRSPGRGARRGFDPATVTIGWTSLPAS